MNQVQQFTGRTSGITYLRRIPSSEPIATVIMLHGLGGNENSMWVLESALPRETVIVSPRGGFKIGSESYSWVETKLPGWPTVKDFLPAVNAMHLLIEELREDRVLGGGKIFLMGFSQGAALAFTAGAVLQPTAVIAAAGFVPQGDLSGLRGMPIFWGHGQEDSWIPIATARQGVKSLGELGAKVDFCEAQVAHKLGLECLQGLKKWFSKQLNGR